MGAAALASIYGALYVLRPSPLRDYRIAVTTEDEKEALTDAKVETSVESIINGNGHLWNIEIQSRNLPSDRKVTITAENKVDFLRGRKEVTLGKEANKSVTIVMTRDRSARAFGSVVDEGQKPIADALVYVIGYENEATHTGDKGQFDLPAHAANGEPIRVRVEKKGYGPEEAVNFSGNESIPIVLSRSRR